MRYRHEHSLHDGLPTQFSDGMDVQGTGVPFPAQAKCSSLKPSARAWGTFEILWGYRFKNTKLTTQVHLAPNLGISGAMPQN
jgi:hypothetical protein